MKICPRCEKLIPLEDFHRNSGRPDGRCHLCKKCKCSENRKYRDSRKSEINARNRRERRENHEACRAAGRAYYAKHKERLAAQHREIRRLNPLRDRTDKLNRKWGYARLKALAAAQGNKCGICGREGLSFGSGSKADSWAVDHNHQTGELRGLLCKMCNLGIGHFQDSPKLLEAAIRYLQSVMASELAQETTLEMSRKMGVK